MSKQALAGLAVGMIILYTKRVVKASMSVRGDAWEEMFLEDEAVDRADENIDVPRDANNFREILKRTRLPSNPTVSEEYC
ncbi:hypothetical protein BC939DRAFT_457405 [Gamsiella multidivaricata]|uniref:uncharacterized protein n=1 Tax=Gamsiella multidivaricata TaxID=101098 RepID=UPI00221EC4E7|nr:uncharacterized protein BC939DRAFT_457405 [Gamsiella multidivaricata]KAI7820698.1 hypothetical protein BC939DRAFT_457405 [Gamsiella multidivaricata]